MNDFDLELATDLIQGGMPADEAVRAATENDDRFLTEMVLPIGQLGGAPDPACVAAQLNGIENPTPEDIARAVDHCSR